MGDDDRRAAATRLPRERLLEHWRDEGDSAHLYARLARRVRDPEARAALERLARDERGHQTVFEEMLGRVPRFRPSWRTRALLLVSRLLGARLVLAMATNEEGREVERFLHEAAAGVDEPWVRRLARESAHHATVLGRLSGSSGDPWHHIDSGGRLRNVVYGFNDGLTANFGLIAGMLGAAIQRDVVLLSGFAGLLASSLSMAASGYLAAQSQREVDQNEINIQRAELVLFPQREEDYLADLYADKGLTQDEARSAARRVMADPEVALRELTREKLKISEEADSPVTEGVTTGLATVFGAVVPIVPFFFGGGPVAAWSAFVVAMAMHFVVGAMRSVFTGRPWLRSGLDMFVVGLGVAAFGYLLGFLLTGIFPAG
ncbi:MAG TPA: VIT1/CCC1 transporter family protein [Trueperaceae bacterium]|nr:VIT1/CCC1 transporter family protein [Trueperaceae bacterium]